MLTKVTKYLFLDIDQLACVKWDKDCQEGVAIRYDSSEISINKFQFKKLVELFEKKRCC